jgi:hypothetical protein
MTISPLCWNPILVWVFVVGQASSLFLVAEYNSTGGIVGKFKYVLHLRISLLCLLKLFKTILISTGISGMFIRATSLALLEVLLLAPNTWIDVPLPLTSAFSAATHTHTDFFLPVFFYFEISRYQKLLCNRVRMEDLMKVRIEDRMKVRMEYRMKVRIEDRIKVWFEN